MITNAQVYANVIRALIANLLHGNQRLSLECSQERQSLPVCLNFSVEIRDGIAFARHVNRLSRLDVRDSARDGYSEDLPFTTLLNSEDPAAPFLALDMLQ